MDLGDVYIDWTLFREIERLEGISRLTKIRTKSLGESVELLERENLELRVYLKALVSLLAERGLLRADDVQQKALALLPGEIEIATAQAMEKAIAKLPLAEKPVDESIERAISDLKVD